MCACPNINTWLDCANIGKNALATLASDANTILHANYVRPLLLRCNLLSVFMVVFIGPHSLLHGVWIVHRNVAKCETLNTECLVQTTVQVGSISYVVAVIKAGGSNKSTLVRIKLLLPASEQEKKPDWSDSNMMNTRFIQLTSNVFLLSLISPNIAMGSFPKGYLN